MHKLALVDLLPLLNNHLDKKTDNYRKSSDNESYHKIIYFRK